MASRLQPPVLLQTPPSSGSARRHAFSRSRPAIASRRQAFSCSRPAIVSTLPASPAPTAVSPRAPQAPLPSPGPSWPRARQAFLPRSQARPSPRAAAPSRLPGLPGALPTIPLGPAPAARRQRPPAPAPSRGPLRAPGAPGPSEARRRSRYLLVELAHVETVSAARPGRGSSGRSAPKGTTDGARHTRRRTPCIRRPRTPRSAHPTAASPRTPPSGHSARRSAPEDLAVERTCWARSSRPRRPGTGPRP